MCPFESGLIWEQHTYWDYMKQDLDLLENLYLYYFSKMQVWGWGSDCPGWTRVQTAGTHTQTHTHTGRDNLTQSQSPIGFASLAKSRIADFSALAQQTWHCTNSVWFLWDHFLHFKLVLEMCLIRLDKSGLNPTNIRFTLSLSPMLYIVAFL